MNKRQFFKGVLPLLVLMGMGTTLGIRWWLWAQNRTDVQEVVRDFHLQHLGIIMDGNRRWACKQGFKPWIGHKHGVTPLKMAVEFCLKYGLPYLTVYALSLENLKRPAEELSYLFDVLAPEIMDQELKKLGEQGVRVRFVGDRTQFPARLREKIEHVEQETAQNNRLVFTWLFCYGGQQEIIAAARSLCHELLKNRESADAVTQERFEKHLWSAGVPAPDLVIRTGCASRLSNFLSYESAYSELYFLNKYWPDVVEEDLNVAVRSFAQCKRTFGL